MDKFFYQLYLRIQKQKIVWATLLFILLIIFGFLASKLQFEEDITKLIPNSEKSDLTNKVLKNVNFADKIIVYLEAKNDANADDLTDYAREFVDSVQNQSDEFIKEIQGRIADDDIDKALNFIYQNLPLFLDDADYQ